MDKKPKPGDLLPGDVVQVTGDTYKGALVIVDDVRPWGVTGDAPHLIDRGPVSQTIPLRLKHSEFEKVGPAVLLTPALAKARRLALETLALVAADKAAGK
jgi:hypothetical protein